MVLLARMEVGVLGDGVDTSIRCTEQLEAIIASVDTGMRNHVHITEQLPTVRLDICECYIQICGQEASCGSALTFLPGVSR